MNNEDYLREGDIMRTFLSITVIYLIFSAFACKNHNQLEQPENKRQALEEIKDGRIELEYIFPKEGFKNSNYLIKHYPGIYKYEGIEIPEALIDDIVTAAKNNLIPANATYACNYGEKSPRFKISIPRDNDKYVISSASNCLNRAPWNIQHNDKLYTQLTGELFAPLEKLLKHIDPAKWENIQKPEGIINLALPWEEPENFKNTPPLDETFITALATSENLTKLIPAPEINKIEVACDQKQSPDCKQLLAVASLKIDENTDLNMNIIFKEMTPELVNPPPSIDIATKLANSQIAQAMHKIDNSKLLITFDPAMDCEAVKVAAPTYLPNKNPEEITDCSRWMLYFEPKPDQKAYPPRIIYYTALDAAWITFATDLVDTRFFTELDPKADPDTLLEESALFSSLDGKITPLAN